MRDRLCQPLREMYPSSDVAGRIRREAKRLPEQHTILSTGQVGDVYVVSYSVAGRNWGADPTRSGWLAKRTAGGRAAPDSSGASSVSCSCPDAARAVAPGAPGWSGNRLSLPGSHTGASHGLIDLNGGAGRPGHPKAKPPTPTRRCSTKAHHAVAGRMVSTDRAASVESTSNVRWRRELSRAPPRPPPPPRTPRNRPHRDVTAPRCPHASGTQGRSSRDAGPKDRSRHRNKIAVHLRLEEPPPAPPCSPRERLTYSTPPVGPGR